jgi:pimeloyl-ACP methyl ester carboxylesterase
MCDHRTVIRESSSGPLWTWRGHDPAYISRSGELCGGTHVSYHVQLSFDTFGSGSALLVIHGTGSTPSRTWGSTLERLGASFTVVAPCLPGSGSSPLPDGPLAVSELATQLVNAAHRAGHDRFAVAGASLGSPIALEIASTFPDQVTHVVSLSGFLKPRPSLLLRYALWKSLMGGDPLALGRLLLTLALPESATADLTPEQLDAFALGVAGQIEPGATQQLEFSCLVNVEAQARSVVAPTLVVCGLEDNFVHPAHSRDIVDAVVNAKLIELPTSGHGVSPADADIVLTAINEFVHG